MKHLALAVVLAAGLFPGAALACTVPAGAKAMESGLIDWINGARAQLEVSGGVDLESICAIAGTGVDRISIGKLTKDLRAVGLSMRVTG